PKLRPEIKEVYKLIHQDNMISGEIYISTIDEYLDGEQPTEKQQDGEQPTEKQHGGEQPTEKQQDGEQPTEKQQDGEQPTEKQQDGEQPTEKQQDGEQPTEKQNKQLTNEKQEDILDKLFKMFKLTSEKLSIEEREVAKQCDPEKIADIFKRSMEE
ncbi:441_t:CDS:2, partial [Racocetra persica]